MRSTEEIVEDLILNHSDLISILHNNRELAIGSIGLPPQNLLNTIWYQVGLVDGEGIINQDVSKCLFENKEASEGVMVFGLKDEIKFKMLSIDDLEKLKNDPEQFPEINNYLNLQSYGNLERKQELIDSRKQYLKEKTEELFSNLPVASLQSLRNKINLEYETHGNDIEAIGFDQYRGGSPASLKIFTPIWENGRATERKVINPNLIHILKEKSENNIDMINQIISDQVYIAQERELSSIQQPQQRMQQQAQAIYAPDGPAQQPRQQAQAIYAPDGPVQQPKYQKTLDQIVADRVQGYSNASQQNTKLRLNQYFIESVQECVANESITYQEFLDMINNSNRVPEDQKTKTLNKIIDQLGTKKFITVGAATTPLTVPIQGGGYQIDPRLIGTLKANANGIKEEVRKVLETSEAQKQVESVEIGKRLFNELGKNSLNFLNDRIESLQRGGEKIEELENKFYVSNPDNPVFAETQYQIADQKVQKIDPHLINYLSNLCQRDLNKISTKIQNEIDQNDQKAQELLLHFSNFLPKMCNTMQTCYREGKDINYLKYRVNRESMLSRTKCVAAVVFSPELTGFNDKIIDYLCPDGNFQTGINKLNEMIENKQKIEQQVVQQPQYDPDRIVGHKLDHRGEQVPLYQREVAIRLKNPHAPQKQIYQQPVQQMPFEEEKIVPAPQKQIQQIGQQFIPEQMQKKQQVGLPGGGTPPCLQQQAAQIGEQIIQAQDRFAPGERAFKALDINQLNVLRKNASNIGSMADNHKLTEGLGLTEEVGKNLINYLLLNPKISNCHTPIAARISQLKKKEQSKGQGR